MAAPWAAIIQAVEKKKDRIHDALGSFANQQAQIANAWGGNSGGFQPVSNQQTPLQTNNGGLISRIFNNNMGSQPQQTPQPQNLGAIGQGITQEAPSASDLFKRLMGY